MRRDRLRAPTNRQGALSRNDAPRGESASWGFHDYTKRAFVALLLLAKSTLAVELAQRGVVKTARRPSFADSDDRSERACKRPERRARYVPRDWEGRVLPPWPP